MKQETEFLRFWRELDRQTSEAGGGRVNFGIASAAYGLHLALEAHRAMVEAVLSRTLA
jgi:hypothetical protein